MIGKHTIKIDIVRIDPRDWVAIIIDKLKIQEIIANNESLLCVIIKYKDVIIAILENIADWFGL